MRQYSHVLCFCQILSWLRRDDSNFDLRALFLSVGPDTLELITSLRQAHDGHIAGVGYGEHLDMEELQEKLQLEGLVRVAASGYSHQFGLG